ncbi:MAG TPA: hypothetical protein VJL58_06805, partial [Pyrinomonadaceae bacterium]|nr:hypothetical protein [Pyrinomonadaceae bacterium]
MVQCIVAFILVCTLYYAGNNQGVNNTGYEWSNVTQAAEFPQGYNYPVFVFGDWMVTLNNGAWLSNDGHKWTKTDLSESGLNSAYQKYLQFDGAIYALGSLKGNYERFTVSTAIKRTRDFRRWETVEESSNLPQRIFYGAAVFDNKMWIIGGYDGKRYLNDVWNSTDGVHWKQVAANTAWSPRTTTLTVFNERLWILGGGTIDGEKNPNPNSYRELWSSPDGVTWTKVNANFEKKWGGSPIVYDEKLWLVGMNRGAGFGSAVWVTNDGLNWEQHSAPWSPRGAVAAWVF